MSDNPTVSIDSSADVAVAPDSGIADDQQAVVESLDQPSTLVEDPVPSPDDPGKAVEPPVPSAGANVPVVPADDEDSEADPKKTYAVYQPPTGLVYAGAEVDGVYFPAGKAIQVTKKFAKTLQAQRDLYFEISVGADLPADTPVYVPPVPVVAFESPEPDGWFAPAPPQPVVETSVADQDTPVEEDPYAQVPQSQIPVYW